MSPLAYILKRIFAAIPLLTIVSMISFAIIRLNISITSVNISYLIFLPIGLFIFYQFTKIKNWYFLGTTSLVAFLLFSIYLAKFNIIPVDTFINNIVLVFIFNCLIFFTFFLIYWLQSFTQKSRYIPQIITCLLILVSSIYISNQFAINVPIKPIILKSGDPLADLRFNPSISKERIEREEQRLGLDKPYYVQYLLWLKGLAHGDLGITQQNQPVVKIIQRPLLNTLILSLSTLICTWFLAIPLGIWAALNRNKLIDKSLAIFTSCGMSTPSFVLAVLGLLFALKTQILPIGGLTSVNHYELNFYEKLFDIFQHLLLPTLVLTVIAIAGLQRQMRANLLDVLRQEYIKTAIAKGLPTHKVVYKHALRNAINPLITIFGFELSALLSGAALTETVLAYPGLGALTLEAARKLDINLTMVTLMLGATMLIIGNLIADLLLKYADPRIKLGVT
ncbi:MAG: ABC transporter permease subunit [Candidatus Melainabacteria bacterium]|nr:ABC transporter permease subunit [Candidatus Melainabacteria bacterium]